MKKDPKNKKRATVSAKKTSAKTAVKKSPVKKAAKTAVKKSAIKKSKPAKKAAKPVKSAAKKSSSVKKTNPKSAPTKTKSARIKTKSVPVKVKSAVPSRVLKIVLAVLDRHKAEKIAVLDVGKKSSFTDHMVIAEGSNPRLLAAVASHLAEELKRAKVPCHIEAGPGASWVLVDAGDVVLSLMTAEMRGYYRLEDIWK